MPYHVTLACHSRHYPKKKKPASGIQDYVIEETSCPYTLFVPSGYIDDTEEMDTYFVPRQKWLLDAGDASKRLTVRRDLTKSFAEQENMYLIVHTVTAFVDPKTKRFTEEGLGDALRELGVTHTKFINRVTAHIASGDKHPALTYYELMNLICDYICGTAMTENTNGVLKERWRHTVDACYKLFDPPSVDSGYVPLADLKATRGKLPACDNPADTYTFPMHKALLDFVSKQAITRVLFRQELEDAWLSSPSLTMGFVEEVLRLILTEKYEVPRGHLYRE